VAKWPARNPASGVPHVRNNAYRDIEAQAFETRSSSGARVGDRKIAAARREKSPAGCGE
jgi:hypothetical protein